MCLFAGCIWMVRNFAILWNIAFQMNNETSEHVLFRNIFWRNRKKQTKSKKIHLLRCEFSRKNCMPKKIPSVLRCRQNKSVRMSCLQRDNSRLYCCFWDFWHISSHHQTWEMENSGCILNEFNFKKIISTKQRFSIWTQDTPKRPKNTWTLFLCNFFFVNSSVTHSPCHNIVFNVFWVKVKI